MKDARSLSNFDGQTGRNTRIDISGVTNRQLRVMLPKDATPAEMSAAYAAQQAAKNLVPPVDVIIVRGGIPGP